MAIKQVTTAGIKKDASAGSFRRAAAFTGDFKMLNLNKPGQNFKIRILPPNNDESIWKESYEGFAFAVPSHYGVGDNGKETCICPNKLAPRYRVTCPMCEEYKSGQGTPRSKLSFYYYMNCVLLSKHEEVERQDAEGNLIVYTIKVPKATVFDVIAAYMENQERGVVDPFSLKDGCAITISVTEKKVGTSKYPQYMVQFNEASKADISNKVRENDIKDLRLIGRFIPTSAAMRNIAEGMPINEAMDVCGKIDTSTGKQIGGVLEAEKKPVAAAEKKEAVVEEDELLIDKPATKKTVESADDLDADLIIDDDADLDL